MKYDRKHFPNIEEFLGIDWIEAGCSKLDSDIGQMVAQGILDSPIDAKHHPIHIVWYNHIVGKSLPHDLIVHGDSKIATDLRQGHRLLTLEQLLAKLRPTWSVEIADSVRDKLRNTPEFESTLYELLVVLNFRKAGHDVNIRLPVRSATADIGGNLFGVPTHVECKRVTFRAKPHAIRLAELDSLAQEVLNVVCSWDESTMVSIEGHRPIGTSELDGLRSLFSGMDAPPDWRGQMKVFGPWSILISIVEDGQPQLTGNFDYYDILKTDGLMDQGTGTVTKFRGVAIKDDTPADWSAVVRDSLNTARRQFERNCCNIVCLEVADMPYFTKTVEFERVFDAIEKLLDSPL